jgi:PIN domain nuclease of toxin-antitoxin system
MLLVQLAVKMSAFLNAEEHRVSAEGRRACAEFNSLLSLSAASAWEIVIKVRLIPILYEDP